MILWSPEARIDNCPVCMSALIKSSVDRYTCSNHHYSCSKINPIGIDGVSFAEIFVIGNNEEMFNTGCIAFRIFYSQGVYLKHQIYLNFKHKRPFKIELIINDEDFIRLFSRDNLHPLLQKIEILKVFS